MVISLINITRKTRINIDRSYSTVSIGNNYWYQLGLQAKLQQPVNVPSRKNKKISQPHLYKSREFFTHKYTVARN